MQEQVSSLRKQFQDELSQVQHSKEVEQLKVKYLGKKGPIQDLMQHLRDTPHEMRPIVGQQINELKEEICQPLRTGAHEFFSSRTSQAPRPKKKSTSHCPAAAAISAENTPSIKSSMKSSQILDRHGLFRPIRPRHR